MAPQNTKKLFAYSNLRSRTLLEAMLKERSEANGSSQSAIIEQALSQMLLPANAHARMIVEDLYNGQTLGESYVTAIRSISALETAAQSEPVVKAFFNNISMLQPRFTGKEPEFSRLLEFIDGVTAILRENTDDPRLVVDLKEDLVKWPELTPIIFIVGPIVGKWDAFYRSGYALAVLEACAAIAAPSVVDRPNTRGSFVDALKSW